MSTSISTYKQIQDRTLDLLSKSDTTTRNRIKNWINMGYLDFVNRELWPFREATGTLDTVVNTQEYDLSTNFPDIDEQNILSVALQGSAASKLAYIPFNQLRASAPDFDSHMGIPINYYLRAGQIGFYYVPNDVITLVIDYYKNATELSADADEPIIPINYREALMHYALAMEHNYNTDPDLAQGAMNSYENKLTLARQNLLAQPVDTGGFTILGPADFRNWTDIGR